MWMLRQIDKTGFSFIYSFILETYIAPLQETTTQSSSQPSHRQRRRTSERCKIWKCGSPEGTTAQRGDHSMLMDPQLNRPITANYIYKLFTFCFCLGHCSTCEASNIACTIRQIKSEERCALH